MIRFSLSEWNWTHDNRDIKALNWILAGHEARKIFERRDPAGKALFDELGRSEEAIAVEHGTQI